MFGEATFWYDCEVLPNVSFWLRLAKGKNMEKILRGS